MSDQKYRIAVLLPFAENFSNDKAGAISLFCFDLSSFSRYRSSLIFYGKELNSSPPQHQYRGLKPRFRTIKGRNIGLASAFYHSVKHNPPDLIEIHNRPQVFFYLKRKLPKIPISLFLHNDATLMKPTRSPQARKKLLDMAAAIYCVSDYIRQRFLENTDVDKESARSKLHVLYNGIGRLSDSLTDKQNLILYAGRIVEEKGALEFAEASALVLPDYPDWKAVMIGSQRHGQTGRLSEFEARVQECLRPLGPQAEFLGHRPYAEVLQFFQHAAIVAVPSKWNEPLGRTAIEALASGSALISSANGGLAEINNGCGMLLKTVNRDSLAYALNSLLSDNDMRKTIQQKCWDAFSQFEQKQVSSILDEHRDALLLPKDS
ncbi:glycosyltransferase family 4 protein [Methylotuvimicrobium sp.]|uniref:glycosyltransferase family 4 protein n=1 Tax=Methylotuvimicrobium sp. TaxID=2822413 RepID=UPI003D65AA7F